MWRSERSLDWWSLCFLRRQLDSLFLEDIFTMRLFQFQISGGESTVINLMEDTFLVMVMEKGYKDQPPICVAQIHPPSNGLSLPLVIMWVADFTWAKVWTVWILGIPYQKCRTEDASWMRGDTSSRNKKSSFLQKKHQDYRDLDVNLHIRPS